MHKLKKPPSLKKLICRYWPSLMQLHHFGRLRFLLLTSSQLTERSDLEIPGFKVGEPELAGSPVAQRAMWPKLIVILSPTFDLVTGVIQ